MIDLARFYHDEITHWATGETNAHGFATFQSPSLLKGRWEERREQTSDDKGETLTTSGVVYLSKAVKTGDYVYLGDATSTTDPKQVNGSRRVVDFLRIPPLHGRPKNESAYENRALLEG
jgi:hypothetical protein